MPERSRSRNRKGFLYHLGRWAWVVLVAELTFAASVPFFALNQFWHPQVIACVSAIAVGVAAAFFSRLLLTKNQIVLRFFFPWSCLLLALVAMDAFTRGEAGFGIFLGRATTASLLGLIPLFMGTGAIVLAMLAWTKKRKLKKAKVRRIPASRSIRQPPVRQAVRRARPAAATRRAATQPSRVHGAAPARRQTITRSAATSLPLRVKARKKDENGLRLIGSEEHRCPYCLEVVQPNDARGVVICDICHAYHHKDCWDVTGRCQVPHLTAAA